MPKLIENVTGEPVAAHVQTMIDSPNPDYQVRHVENRIPFALEAALIGASAGRVYLREQNRLVAVTLSTHLMVELRDKIDAALKGGVLHA